MSSGVNLAIDPRGLRTTILGGGTANVKAVIDPLGQRTSYTWSAYNRLAALQDPRGNRTSFSYTTLGDRSVRLQAVQTPVAGRICSRARWGKPSPIKPARERRTGR